MLGGMGAAVLAAVAIATIFASAGRAEGPPEASIFVRERRSFLAKLRPYFSGQLGQTYTEGWAVNSMQKGDDFYGLVVLANKRRTSVVLLECNVEFECIIANPRLTADDLAGFVEGLRTSPPKNATKEPDDDTYGIYLRLRVKDERLTATVTRWLGIADKDQLRGQIEALRESKGSPITGRPRGSVRIEK